MAGCDLISKGTMPKDIHLLEISENTFCNKFDCQRHCPPNRDIFSESNDTSPSIDSDSSFDHKSRQFLAPGRFSIDSPNIQTQKLAITYPIWYMHLRQN
jgi:hypothetical protein